MNTKITQKTENCITCNNKRECCLRIVKNDDTIKCDENTCGDLGLNVKPSFSFEYNSDYETHL